MKPDANAVVPVVACVEDDAAVREALEGMLFAFGYAPETYGSAEAFLEGAERERISCLIVDVELGAMSGLELVRLLATAAPRLPAIVVTAFGDERTRTQALALGAVAFLRKPVAQDDLLAAIVAALRKGSSGDAGA